MQSILFRKKSLSVSLTASHTASLFGAGLMLYVLVCESKCFGQYLLVKNCWYLTGAKICGHKESLSLLYILMQLGFLCLKESWTWEVFIFHIM